MSCSNNWIVEMENMLEDANPSVEMVHWKKTSIYRVPEWIKDLTNEKAYRPWLVSLGPFHHGEPDLLPMEEHKRRAVLHLVKRSGRPLRDFVTAIEQVADNLQEAYQGLDEKWCGDGKGRFVEMMVTDGCFLLEVMRAFAQIVEGKAVDDYAPNDPVFSKQGLIYSFGPIRTDMMVIENQLPLLALERLVAAQDGMPPIANDINDNVCRLLGGRAMNLDEINELGLHPLDLFHSIYCGGRRHLELDESPSDTVIPSALELREAGIHFKKSKTRYLHDFEFENGVLSMPELQVDDSTKKEFMNLIAFEQLHGDAGSNVTEYLFFMDNIINSNRDVALLRSKGIINNLIDDQEVADLFNVLTKGASSIPTAKMSDVKNKVNAYCEKKRNKWRAFFKQTYLRNPWVFISLLAAIIIVVATLLQTIYTVVPFYTRS